LFKNNDLTNNQNNCSKKEKKNAREGFMLGGRKRSKYYRAGNRIPDPRFPDPRFRTIIL